MSEQRDPDRSPGQAGDDAADQGLVDTRHGQARLCTSPAAHPWASLALGHGAGGGTQTRDLGWLAADLPPAGVTVIRIEQPWRVAGRAVASRPAVLDEGWLDALAHVRFTSALVVGGRSAGARVACRTAASVGAVGVLALAFPLLPPWRPERSRLPELLAAGVPTLVVQGDRDAFGTPADFPDFSGRGAGIRLVSVAGADHSFAVRRQPGSASDSTRADLVGAVLGWLRETVPAP